MLTAIGLLSNILDMITAPARTSILDHAIAYAERGWHVFPCRARGKEPNGALAPNGYKSATNDYNTIVDWFGGANHNIGIACRPSGIVVIDVDYRTDGAYDDARSMWGHELPETYMVETGNGVHFYYAMPDTNAKMRGKLYSLDIKWNGYVLAPPSIHPSGAVYAGYTTPIAEAPDALIALITR